MALILGALLPALVQGEQTDHKNVAEHSDEAHHMNVFGIFFGLASQDRRDGLSLGIEYERRFGEWFGIGLGVERSFGDIDAFVYTLPLAIHSGRWKSYIGPGVEETDECRLPGKRSGRGHRCRI